MLPIRRRVVFQVEGLPVQVDRVLKQLGPAERLARKTTVTGIPHHAGHPLRGITGLHIVVYGDLVRLGLDVCLSTEPSAETV